MSICSVYTVALLLLCSFCIYVICVDFGQLKVKDVYSSSLEPISEPYAITCQPTQVNVPHLNPGQGGR